MHPLLPRSRRLPWRPMMVTLSVLLTSAFNLLHLTSYLHHYSNGERGVKKLLSVQPHTFDNPPSFEQQRYNIVIVVPGHGDNQRLPQLKETLESLRRSALSQNVGFECLVYVWNDHLLLPTTHELNKCLVLSSHGLWTHHMLKVGQNESRAMIANSTHVSILMDDVDATSINLPRFLHTMEQANFTVAAPSVDGAYPSAYPRPYCMAHATQFVDILFTTFTTPQWRRHQQQINTTINSYGWGYDVTLADVCNATIGVVDHERIYHPAAETDNARSYSAKKAKQELTQWLAIHKPNKFRNQYHYFKYVTLERPWTLPYCQDVAFHTAIRHQANQRSNVTLPFPASVWQGTNGHAAFIATVPQAPFTNTFTNETRSIELLGSIDDWFGLSNEDATNDTVLMDKWVGFSHSVNTDDDSTTRLLQSTDFLASAPHCVALFAYTSTTAKALTKQLNGIGIHKISVCSVHYPIHLQYNNNDGVRTIAPLIDWKVLLEQRRLTALVLWDQPYSRVASLHALQTQRAKIWLTSVADVTKVTKAELVAENVSRDKKVHVHQVTGLQDYEQMMYRSIVLVDTWAEGSYEAAVQALQWKAPFLFRKLKGYVEYLGENYPLFFSSLDEVQNLMDDNNLLMSKMLDAHYYLKDRDTSAFTLEFLSNQVSRCTVEAMAGWKH